MDSKEMSYEDNLRLWKRAYTEIAKACTKYSEFKEKYSSDFRDIHEMNQSCQNHLLLIDWYEKYGIKLEHEYKPYSYNYFRLDDYRRFSYYNDSKVEKDSGNGGKFISWSDDGRQPLNEWLFEIGFSTGAFIFGEDYEGQQELFQEFFQELKSYKPDYIDSANKCLYWKLQNAKSVFDNFYGILLKYRERNRGELKTREILKLQEKLEKLKNNS